MAETKEDDRSTNGTFALRRALSDKHRKQLNSTNGDFEPIKLILAQPCISCRNQSFVLQSKTNDWFLYEMQY